MTSDGTAVGAKGRAKAASGDHEERTRALVERASAKGTTRRSAALAAGGYPTVALLGTLVLWEIATDQFSIKEFILPAPSAILLTAVQRWPLLADHALTTLFEVTLGFVISIAVGIPLAVAITYFKPFARMVYPLLVSAQTIPKVALAPVFVVWFGFDLTPKILIAFLITFFPIVIGTSVGLQSSPPEMLHLARSMGASAWQKFWLIRWPTALPSTFGGLKVAITLAVVGALVGEFVGASKGLGYLIQFAGGQLDTRLVFAAIAVVSLMGILLFMAVDLVERRLLSWHVSERLEQLDRM